MNKLTFLHRWARHSLACLFLLATVLPASAAEDQARTVLHLLDYIAVDYSGAVENGKIVSADEYQEMREFSRQAQALIQGLPANPAQAGLQADAAALVQAVEEKQGADAVAAKANALRWAVIKAYQVQVAPRKAPDLALGARLYASQCAACHGAEGKGDGPASKGLEPAPSNFHDAARLAQRSTYGLYNTISLGVNGTSMPAFSQLSEDERWALAFFVGNFAADDASRKRGEELWKAGKGRQQFPDLGNVATLSANEARERFGADGLNLQTWLRSAPQALVAAKPAPLDFAATTLAASRDAYRQGKRAEAGQLAIQAYLEGFELAETSLSIADAELMTRIERDMMAFRGAIQSGAPVEQVDSQAEALLASLAEAKDKLSGAQMSNLAIFLSALLILLREGAEAILVVAAILAFTKRADRPAARMWVHVGWIAALALGFATWIVSRHLIEISGASREVTEGVTALFSAAMLLYVGYWLHSKANSKAWQKFIGEKVGGSLSTGTLWTLAMVSFLAVYREAFETVLFFEALSAQAGPEGQHVLMSGVAAGAVLLVGLAWAILRASVRLPLGPFFSISGLTLVALAVVFTGQGIAALQEAGKIGADAVNFIRVPLLGIYPTVQSLAAQAVALAISILALWRTWSGRGAPASSSSKA